MHLHPACINAPEMFWSRHILIATASTNTKISPCIFKEVTEGAVKSQFVCRSNLAAQVYSLVTTFKLHSARNCTDTWTAARTIHIIVWYRHAQCSYYNFQVYHHMSVHMLCNVVTLHVTKRHHKPNTSIRENFKAVLLQFLTLYPASLIICLPLALQIAGTVMTQSKSLALLNWEFACFSLVVNCSLRYFSMWAMTSRR